LVLLCYALWLVKKAWATSLTNQTQNQKQLQILPGYLQLQYNISYTKEKR